MIFHHEYEYGRYDCDRYYGRGPDPIGDQYPAPKPQSVLSAWRRVKLRKSHARHRKS